MKVSERQELAAKLVTVLKRQYDDPPEEPDRSVLDTLIFSVCLEDNSIETGTAVYEKLLSTFHDLNEIRVSTIQELMVPFKGVTVPELRGHRIRTALQTVFEDRYEFTLEPIRKKTLDQATAALGKIRDLSPFNHRYTLQHALSGHFVPVDRTTAHAAIWLGLAPAGSDEAVVSDLFKSALLKADALRFNHLLRRFATDERFAAPFGPKWSEPEAGFDPGTAVKRLKAAFDDPATLADSVPPPPEPEPAEKKPAAGKKSGGSKSASKSKPTAKKSEPAKKSPAKKPAAAPKKSSAKARS